MNLIPIICLDDLLTSCYDAPDIGRWCLLFESLSLRFENIRRRYKSINLLPPLLMGL